MHTTSMLLTIKGLYLTGPVPIAKPYQYLILLREIKSNYNNL